MVSIHSNTNRTAGQSNSQDRITRGFQALLSLVLLLLSSSTLADSFTASVDRKELTEQETFQLTLSYSPMVVLSSPDIDPVTADFDIVGGPRQMTSHHTINGKSESKTEWTYLLMPKRLGELTIPALELDGEHTDPIQITVSKVSQSVQEQQDKDAFFDIQITEKNDYYVQGQILYVEKLYYRMNHQDANLTSLEIEGARIEELQEPKNYTTVINDQRLGVYERRFAIFPEKAGTLVIPGQRFQAMAVSRNFNSWSSRTRSLSAVSRPITLDIKPIPDSYPVAPWLPASQLSIREVWSEDPAEWQAGTPITRTIRIQADGLAASEIVLPEVTLPSTLKQYPDQTNYQDARSDTGISGVFTQPVALVPTQAGSITLPEIRVPWWNTRTNSLEYATLPERRLAIKPQAGATDSDTANSASRGMNGNTMGASSGSPSSDGARHNAPDSGPWMLIAALLLISNFVTGFLLWRRIVVPETADNPDAGNDSEAKHWRLLRKACQQQDAVTIRQQLIAWAASLGSGSTIASNTSVSLTDVQNRFKDSDELQRLLTQLDRSLFSPQDSAGFGETEKKALLELLEQQRPELLKQLKNKKGLAASELPSLYGAAG